jgi:RNA polymerase sigma factor (sigma-70 family)
MVPDSEIVKRCLKGDGYYQKLLYKRFAGTMMGVCLRFFKRRDEAEDCLQEGFIKVFNNLNSYKGDGSFEGWIRRIMVNTAINILKANKMYDNFVDMDTESLSVQLRTDEESEDSLSSAQLLKMVQDLPEGYRIVFNLYAIEGYTHKEIAEKLNINEGTSKSQLSRARTILQGKISEMNKIIASAKIQ